MPFVSQHGLRGEVEIWGHIPDMAKMWIRPDWKCRFGFERSEAVGTGGGSWGWLEVKQQHILGGF